MNKKIPNIYNYLQEIALYFGNSGVNGKCCDDLSLVECIALKKAQESNLSIQEIGTALNFTKSGATRIIDRLERKGYVTRERSPIDGRVCCVPVTKRGSEVITEITEKFQGLDPKIIDDIKDSLEILVKLIHQKEGGKFFLGKGLHEQNDSKFSCIKC